MSSFARPSGEIEMRIVDRSAGGLEGSPPAALSVSLKSSSVPLSPSSSS